MRVLTNANGQLPFGRDVFMQSSAQTDKLKGCLNTTSITRGGNLPQSIARETQCFGGELLHKLGVNSKLIRRYSETYGIDKVKSSDRYIISGQGVKRLQDSFWQLPTHYEGIEAQYHLKRWTKLHVETMEKMEQKTYQIYWSLKAINIAKCKAMY